MTRKTVVSIVAMLIVSLASLAYMRSVGLPVAHFDSERSASMRIDDTNGLVVGSRVLMRGVDIGRVTSVESSADAITVDLTYREDHLIPTSSTFRVDNLSALGETYIAVLPDTQDGPYLPDGAEIDTDRVTVPTTIKALSERFTRLLDQIDPEQLQEIFAELRSALPDDAAVLSTITRAGVATAAMLDETRSPFTTLLTNLQKMLADSSFIPPGLSGTADHILAFGKGFDGAMTAAQFFTVFAPLPDSISDGAGPLIDNLQKFLDRSAGDIQVLTVDVLPSAMAAAKSMRTMNIGAVLDRALAATASGDALTLDISSPRPR
ncbi:MlaD family protein [Gordonia shandongensis]|uniref:MlaD family protein n=1 Tax=Gordonia shandongensis TaxID=376351 RepID=UPI000414948C|nr:MlaD family protein [Gordonia shandongensis]